MWNMVLVILISILIMVVINNNSGLCEGLICSEEEKIGLLQIKASINHPNGDSYYLREWVDHDHQNINGDCCNWEGVTCDDSTGRVVGLDLGLTRDEDLGDWYLNASLFLPFPQLKTLHLNDNNLAGCYKNHGFGDVSPRLNNLELLDLCYNRLNDTSIFTCISTAVSSVKVLNLSSNNFTAALDISNLSNLSKLQTLILDYTPLPMNFLQRIRLFSSLKVLSMFMCQLHGTLPTHIGLCELTRLEELHLGDNDFQGLLPLCLGNLSSLRILDVSNSQLRGNIAFGPLPNLKSLEELKLSFNYFEAPISFNCFMNHSHLRLISFDYNHLIREPFSQNRIPMLQLDTFTMSNCNSTDFPYFLYTQFNLSQLDLSYNSFTGMFPFWLLENNTGLGILYLQGNSFTGPLQLPTHQMPNFSVLHISDNNILGPIPTNTCFVFSDYSSLFMANNQLTGAIPPCFSNTTSFDYLDLSHNFLTGGIPEHFAATQSFLKLSNNNLGGQLSPSLFNSTFQKYLFLDNNNFVGHLPSVSSETGFSPEVLAFSKNHFTGKIPRWIGNMSYAQILDFSGNKFEGSIPTELCNLDSLKYLDFSENNLTGHVPSCFNPSGIKHIYLQKNHLSGALTSSIYNSSSFLSLDLSESSLHSLDLSENLLDGPIPSWVSKLSALSVLLLRENQFVGNLPNELCWLTQLSILDLSRNKFSGSIPSCLSNFTLTSSDKSDDSLTSKDFAFGETSMLHTEDTEVLVDFTTKRNLLTFKGDNLNYMSGIDLSCNRFTGEIPPEIGNLSQLYALNLSYNSLIGSIPTTFSGLVQIESLDLSYNNLSGEIPRQFLELHSLAVFSVAHNNLSGKTPDMKNQFGTFDESSYEGNPFLCGPPLREKCEHEGSTSSSPEHDDEEDVGWIDMEAFRVTFGVSYTVVVLAIATILRINPYWRRVWFYRIEVWTYNCYYFLILCNRR